MCSIIVYLAAESSHWCGIQLYIRHLLQSFMTKVLKGLCGEISSYQMEMALWLPQDCNSIPVVMPLGITFGDSILISTFGPSVELKSFSTFSTSWVSYKKH